MEFHVYKNLLLLSYFMVDIQYINKYHLSTVNSCLVNTPQSLNLIFLKKILIYISSIPMTLLLTVDN